MTLSDDAVSTLLSKLTRANRDVALRYPGASGARQPVHTVYGGAHLFKSDIAQKLGKLARRNLDQYGGDPHQWCQNLGLHARSETATLLLNRVRAKLETEPVEDFRIDYEDGYGIRPNREEDRHAREGARQVALGMREGTLPAFTGIRIKPLSDDLAARSLRTLDLFISTLARETGGKLPPGFVVTLPKITTPAHVEVLVRALGALESALGIPAESLQMEHMIETPQSIIGADGHCLMPAFAQAAQGRLVAAHFGTYDYTAACGITAEDQHMGHTACDFARNAMQVVFAGTEVYLSDGATHILPVPTHRGENLTDAQLADNTRRVHNAWRLHITDIKRSLAHGYYQSWDLHPAQLVTRYAAVYDFFLAGLDAATERLTNFITQAAQATLVGDVFDDAATGQGLLNFFLRGISCGAFPESAALNTGITIEELGSRSFVKILNNRRHAS